MRTALILFIIFKWNKRGDEKIIAKNPWFTFQEPYKKPKPKRMNEEKAFIKGISWKWQDVTKRCVIRCKLTPFVTCSCCCNAEHECMRSHPLPCGPSAAFKENHLSSSVPKLILNAQWFVLICGKHIVRTASFFFICFAESIVVWAEMLSASKGKKKRFIFRLSFFSCRPSLSSSTSYATKNLLAYLFKCMYVTPYWNRNYKFIIIIYWSKQRTEKKSTPLRKQTVWHRRRRTCLTLSEMFKSPSL